MRRLRGPHVCSGASSPHPRGIVSKTWASNDPSSLALMLVSTGASLPTKRRASLFRGTRIAKLTRATTDGFCSWCKTRVVIFQTLGARQAGVCPGQRITFLPSEEGCSLHVSQLRSTCRRYCGLRRTTTPGGPVWNAARLLFDFPTFNEVDAAAAERNGPASAASETSPHFGYEIAASACIAVMEAFGEPAPKCAFSLVNDPEWQWRSDHGSSACSKAANRKRDRSVLVAELAISSSG